VSFHDRGKYKEAIDYYNQALKINPNSMSATYELALSYLHLKDYENALRYSTKVINSNFQPLLVDAYCVKSSALAGLNKADDAIKLLKEAIKRCGDEYLLHFNLGLSYFKKNDLGMAITHLQKAIEVDTTQSGAFLLYAYALNDSDRWVESFFSYQFFLLLEPNTERSKDTFGEMYDLLLKDISANSNKLVNSNGVDRKVIYDYIKANIPASKDPEKKFKFFEDVTRKMIVTLNLTREGTRNGLLWDFFLPIYSEILTSGYLDVYCRYISSSYFPTSLEWWNNNTDKVDKFIIWFEEGQDNMNPYMDDEFGDDSEEEL